MKIALFYWCAITLLITAIFGEVKNNLSIKQKNKLNADLNVYFKSMNKLADFFLTHEQYVDVIVDYGIFVMNVNLKKVLRDKSRRLPASIIYKTKKLLRKTDELLNFFKKILALEIDPEIDSYRNFLNLFSNETQWISHIEKFQKPNKKHLPHLYNNKKYLIGRYSTWNNYLKATNAQKGSPLPEESDKCLLHMSYNPINYSPRTQKCALPSICPEVTLSGSEEGYALTHRLLILQLARFSRGCNVISEDVDRNLRKKLCSSCYNEANYIAMNDFQGIDLMMEQISFCALEGLSEFIRRDWLAKIVSTQTREGCFPNSNNDYRSNIRSPESWDLNYVRDKLDGKFPMLGGRCDGHTSSLGGMVVASAVRFILETFY